jgi:hypothetical protein
VIGDWRKLHNEELHNLYCSPSVIRMIKLRRMRWAGNIALMREKKNAYRILVGKPEGKRPVGRPRRRGRIILKQILGRANPHISLCVYMCIPLSLLGNCSVLQKSSYRC